MVENIVKDNVNVVKVKKMKVMPVIIWFIIGLILGAGALFAWDKYMSKTPAQLATQVQQAQVQDIVAKVSKLIMLPTGEQPVVATINDAASLIKDQVFYKGAENGDVVLVYQKAAKAVIYSPSRNIIVNVGPIFLQDQNAASTTTPTTAATSTK
jgi:predicted negative regulator of RcsB-dependent stress response